MPGRRLSPECAHYLPLAGLLLVACADTANDQQPDVPQEQWSNANEVLFQQEAALRHTLEEIKLQEQQQQDLTDSQPGSKPDD